MSKTLIARGLLIFFAVSYFAVVEKIEAFPLSWAPMFAGFKNPETYSYPVMNREQNERGFRIFRRDGTSGWAGPKELNIPAENMWRLYYERAYGKKPPHRYKADWEWHMFRCINGALGLKPDDAKFVIRIEANRDIATWSRPELELVSRVPETLVLQWKEEWRSKWE
ncbi:MAG: hypothetical protein ACI8TX_003387 [Hyphomicrobiaceae bacterium]|jgi:hypothetical protein